MKTDLSSTVVTVEFSKFAGILVFHLGGSILFCLRDPNP